MTGERVNAHLNRALHDMFERDRGLFLLGQDIADPYGGAFKVTKGLSTRFPERVISTPISENATLGAASGLALCGHRVLVEVMFGDFLALAFDMLQNFTTKSVAMYGRTTPMQVVIRCPVGGNRGYGPTHSQSPQKHLIGIPHLALYELSAFHDARQLLTELLDLGHPAILFEDKTLYGQWRPDGGQLDDGVRYEPVDHAGNWIRVSAPRVDGPTVVTIVGGGMAGRALTAAARLRAERVNLEVLVPARIYPVDLDPVLALLTDADGVCVAEESTAGGTWGAEVAHAVHERGWDRLRQPVRTISSAPTVIPAARHLERQVLVQADAIHDAVLAMTARTTRGTTAPAGGNRPAHPISVPQLNVNDDGYLLLEWLRADGTRVGAGDAVVVVETAKAVEELTAGATGTLRHRLAAGAECPPGSVLGHVVAEGVAPALDRSPVATPDRARTRMPVQQAVASAVTASHREIPAAFVVLRAEVDAALDALRRHGERTGASVGLAELLVKAIASMRTRVPICFATPQADGTVALPDAVHVAVTVDAGNGLFLPVIRDAESGTLDDISDRLMELRLKAVRGEFRAADLTGANIALSVNHEADVVVVQPIIPPGLACMLTFGGLRSEVDLSGDGELVRRQVVYLGLAHDHRVVNGRDAILVLQAIRDQLASPDGLFD